MAIKDNPYELAKEMLHSSYIDDVRVSKEHITVAIGHQDNENDLDEVDRYTVHGIVSDIIEGTVWKKEYDEPNVEVHDTVGGIHHDSFTEYRRESQIHLVK